MKWCIILTWSICPFFPVHNNSSKDWVVLMEPGSLIPWKYELHIARWNFMLTLFIILYEHELNATISIGQQLWLHHIKRIFSSSRLTEVQIFKALINRTQPIFAGRTLLVGTKILSTLTNTKSALRMRFQNVEPYDERMKKKRLWSEADSFSIECFRFNQRPRKEEDFYFMAMTKWRSAWLYCTVKFPTDAKRWKEEMTVVPLLSRLWSLKQAVYLIK